MSADPPYGYEIVGTWGEGVLLDDSVRLTGDASFKFVGGHGVEVSTPVEPCVPGDHLRIRGALKHTGGGATALSISVEHLDSSGNLISTFDSPLGDAATWNGWLRFSSRVVLPATCSQIRVLYTWDAAALTSSDETWLDFVTVTAEPIAPRMIMLADLSASDVSTYFDGDGVGYAGGPYEAWAIANGSTAGGTTDLDGLVPQLETAGASAGTTYTVGDGAGSITTHKLVPLMRL